MALGKKFLHPKTASLSISKSKFWVALVLGSLYSFIFYSLLYLFREVFRVLSLISNYDLLVLSDSETNFYNLFFGFLSAIVGQSIAFQFLFEKPGKLGRRGKRGLYRMFHDQRFFTWFVLSWLSRVAIIFSSLFILTFDGGTYVFSLYGSYNYLFVLLILVLFFQSWNGPKQIFKREAYKWMLISAVSLSVLAFGLSRINWVNYAVINQIGLKNNVFYHNNLQLPESEFIEIAHRHSINDEIYFVQPKNQIESEPLIYFRNKKLNYRELKDLISKSNKEDVYGERDNKSYQLYIDQSIKMAHVNRLKKELSMAGAYKIFYSLLPKNREYDDRFYKKSGIKDLIVPMDSPWSYDLEFYSSLMKNENNIRIKQYDSGKTQINGNRIDDAEIQTKIKSLLESNPETVIAFEVNDNIIFSDYIKILDLTRFAVNELRNEKAQEKYDMNFDNWDLDFEKEEKIRDLVPYRLIEITSELRKLAPSISSGARGTRRSGIHQNRPENQKEN